MLATAAQVRLKRNCDKTPVLCEVVDVVDLDKGQVVILRAQDGSEIINVPVNDMTVKIVPEDAKVAYGVGRENAPYVFTTSAYNLKSMDNLPSELYMRLDGRGQDIEYEIIVTPFLRDRGETVMARVL